MSNKFREVENELNNVTVRLIRWRKTLRNLVFPVELYIEQFYIPSVTLRRRVIEG